MAKDVREQGQFGAIAVAHLVPRQTHTIAVPQPQPVRINAVDDDLVRQQLVRQDAQEQVQLRTLVLLAFQLLVIQRA